MKKMISLTSDSAKIIKKIMHVQSVINSKYKEDQAHLLIYGAGQHTKKVFECLDLGNWKIKICDKSKTGVFNGITITKPDCKIFEWADTILVSSFYLADGICEEIKKYGFESKILSLYSKTDTMPFYTVELDIGELPKADEINKNFNPYITWVDDGNGEKYENNVEKDFFDVVTKNYFLKYIEPGDKVLDIGAGTGRLSIEVSKKGAHVTAVDTSADMLSIIKKKDKNIKSVVVTNHMLPFEDNSFDKIVSCDAMVHFENWEEFLKEHTRIVRSGGYIVYNMCNDEHLKHISDNKMLRSNYVTGNRNCFSTVTRKELENVAEKMELELVEMIPYGFLVLTSFSYGILSRSEMLQLEQMYQSLFRQDIMREVLGEFEKEYVAKLPEWMTLSNICVFKKK